MFFNSDKRIIFWFANIFLLVGTGSSLAQSVANYTVSRTTSITYNSIISTGSSFSGWRYTGGFSEDDNRSLATDIGFDYWYNGIRYTQFSVSTNGFMDFSSSDADGGPIANEYGYDNAYFTNSTAGTWLAIAPFYDDMTTSGGVDPLGTSIKYLLSGTAPNRVLTVEWDGMAVYQNTSPDINFQVKLYESSGKIEYLYETMDNGTKSFSYTIGINGVSVSRRPKADELLTQQTANSTNFSNRAQNNLSTMPTANSSYQFVPPTPANPVGSLSFSGITNTGMTLNWSDWATNEVGYALYYSSDDVNYYYHSQSTANATSSTVTDLLPNTTYYWRVFAVTEGTLSSALVGNAMTNLPGHVISIETGRWDRKGTWDCNCIPTSADNVIIDDGHRVTIRTSSVACNDLTVGQGTSGELRYNLDNSRDLTVNGNLLINSGALMHVEPGTSNTTHTLNIKGNISNSGTLNFETDANSLCITNFTKIDGNQLVSGTGTNQFYNINIDKGIKSNILEITSTNFTCNDDALTFVGYGTFKFSSTGTNSFSLFSSTRAIPANGKIWMNSTGSTMNFAASVNLYGELVVDDGIVNIGDAANENLISFGGTLGINGGSLNIAGRLDRNNTESTTSFTQTGGTVTLPTIGSTSTTQSPFGLDVSGSAFTMSGGTIILQREGGGGTQDLGINTTGVSSENVTGGILQIGDGSTPASQTMQINLATSIGNLLVNSANATATLISDLDVLANITLTAGVLNNNNNNIDLAGDWLATGGTFTTSTGSTVMLNGTNQSVTTAGSAFNHLTLAGTSTKTFQDNLVVNGNLLIGAAFVAANSGFLANIGGNWTNNSSFTRNNEIITFDGAAAQTISGSAISDFTNIIINKSGGSLINEAALNLYQTLDIQSATTFDADGAGLGVFTLISNAIEDSRIGSLASGASITGDVVSEKYFAGQGFKYWRHIASPVLGATVADLQAEIPISGTFTGNDNGTGVIPINAFPSLYYYDNSTGIPSETFDDRWVVYPSSTNSEMLTSTGTEARGYAIWVRETGAITHNLTGQVNQGSIDFNATGNNEGWNLLGNPYPSDIDWDAATGWTKTDIQGNSIHVWNGSQYLTWNGSIGSLGNGRIAKGQGFWVQAAAGTIALSATELVKTGTATTTHRIFEEDNPPFIELSVTASGYNDMTFIQFVDTAKFEYDIADAPKLSNAVFDLATMSSDSVSLSINALNGSECSFDVPVDLSNTWDDAYSFAWNVKTELLDLYKITVEDIFTSEIYNISTGVGFDFEINTDPLTKQKNRFIIHFETKPISTELLVTSKQDCENIYSANILVADSQLGVEYEIWSSNTLLSTLSGTGNDISYMVDSINLKQGENIFNIRGQRLACPDQEVETIHSLEIINIPVIEYIADNNLLVNNKGIAGYWYNNSELLSDESSISYAPDLNSGGSYTIEVQNNTCSFISESFLITDVIYDEVYREAMLSPNPANNNIDIYSNDKPVKNSTIRIVDVNGKQYYSGPMKSSVTNIDVSEFIRGVYIVIIDNNNEPQRIRFIKL